MVDSRHTITVFFVISYIITPRSWQKHVHGFVYKKINRHKKKMLILLALLPWACMGQAEECCFGTVTQTGAGNAPVGSCCPGDENREQGSCRNDHPNMYGLTGYVCWTGTSGDNWGYCNPTSCAPTASPTAVGWPIYYTMPPGENCPSEHDILSEAECLNAFSATNPDMMPDVTFAGHYDSVDYPRGCAWNNAHEHFGLHVLVNYHAIGSHFDPTTSSHAALCKNHDWENADDEYSALFDPTSAWVDYTSNNCGKQGADFSSTTECPPRIMDGTSYVSYKEKLVDVPVTVNATTNANIVKVTKFRVPKYDPYDPTYTGCPSYRRYLAKRNGQYYCHEKTFVEGRTMCPSSHRFVYRPANNYDYCCKTKYSYNGVLFPDAEEDRPADCQNWDQVPCTNPPCTDYNPTCSMKDNYANWPPPLEGLNGGWGDDTTIVNDGDCAGLNSYNSYKDECDYFSWSVYHCRASSDTYAPTGAPTLPTSAPTSAPTDAPTDAPTTSTPTLAPTDAPTDAPTHNSLDLWQHSEVFDRSTGKTCQQLCQQEVADSIGGAEATNPSACQ